MSHFSHLHIPRSTATTPTYHAEALRSMGGRNARKKGGVGKPRSGGLIGDRSAALAADEHEEEEEGEEEQEAPRGAGGGVVPRNEALRRKLELLAAHASAGRLRDFCAAFLPLDLSAEEASDFVAGLETDTQRWTQIAAEVTALATGDGVRRVIGDQRTRAEFRFSMPGRTYINREVVFVCAEGTNDWRAEG